MSDNGDLLRNVIKVVTECYDNEVLERILQIVTSGGDDYVEMVLKQHGEMLQEIRKTMDEMNTTGKNDNVGDTLAQHSEILTDIQKSIDQIKLNGAELATSFDVLFARLSALAETSTKSKSEENGDNILAIGSRTAIEDMAETGNEGAPETPENKISGMLADEEEGSESGGGGVLGSETVTQTLTEDIERAESTHSEEPGSIIDAQEDFTEGGDIRGTSSGDVITTREHTTSNDGQGNDNSQYDTAPNDSTPNNLDAGRLGGGDLALGNLDSASDHSASDESNVDPNYESHEIFSKLFMRT